MRKTALLLLCLALALPATPALGDSPPPDADGGPVLRFSLELFDETLRAGGKNPLLSPLSAWLALAMAAEGAQSRTLDEFAAVLGLPAEETATCASSLISSLAASGSTTLHIANSGWTDTAFLLDAGYARRIGDSFGAEAFTAELAGEAAMDAINAWVNEKTRGLIPTLHEEPLSPDTVYVLLNTLYFKARWENPFSGHATRAREFRREDGTVVEAQFLHDAERTRDYISLDGAEGVLLPYDDGKTAFLALRPTDGRSARDFARDLAREGLQRYIGAARAAFMDFAMPRFTREYALTLNTALQALGLRLAFDGGTADFSRMGVSELGNVYISEVFQKLKMEVDEEGTEAAAVTEIVMRAMAAPPRAVDVSLVLDSPYVYAVVDRCSGLPLFIGVMEDPS